MSNTYDILLNPPPSKPTKVEEHKAIAPLPVNQPLSKPEKQQPRKQVNQPEPESVRNRTKLINQSINQPLNPLIHQTNHRLMNKPTGFYISEQLDTRLDRAVDYFRRQHGLKKVDRSILLNALLEDDGLWEEVSLNQLIERLIRLLTDRLIG